MLHLEAFRAEDGRLYYELGQTHYTIADADDGNYYVLTVERLTDDLDDIITNEYACSTLSVAVASIEALENGEEI